MKSIRGVMKNKMMDKRLRKSILSRQYKEIRVLEALVLMIMKEGKRELKQE
jgi:hypothetical protein